jgi:hypothetical protein
MRWTKTSVSVGSDGVFGHVTSTYSSKTACESEALYSPEAYVTGVFPIEAQAGALLQRQYIVGTVSGIDRLQVQQLAQ